MTQSPYETPVHDAGYDTYQPTTTYGDNADADADSSASAKDKASDAADAGKQAATEVAQNAAGQAKDVAQETKKQARDLIGEARSQLNEQAGVQHQSLISNLRALADELSNMAANSENGGPATDLVSQAGDRAHGVADWLDKREPGDLLGEVRTFAQKRPGAFLFGALVAGVAAGRLTRGGVAAHSEDSADTETPSVPRHQASNGVAETNGSFSDPAYRPVGYDGGIAP